MNARLIAWLAVAITSCLAAGYGMGSGWVRFGPPDRPSIAGAIPQPEAPDATSIAVRPELLPIPLLDGQVVRAQATTGGTTTMSSTTPATKIVEIREIDPEGSSALYITRNFSQPVLLRAASFSVLIDSADPAAVVSVGSVAGVRDTKNLALFNFGTPPPPAGRGSVVLNAAGVTPTSTAAVEVIVPAGGLTPPTITSESNGIDMLATPVPGGGGTIASPEPIYGQYLKLFGQDAPSSQAGGLSFAVYVPDGNSGNFVYLDGMGVNATTIDPATRTWISTLILPELPMAKQALLFAIARSATPTSQSFSTKLVLQRAPIAYVQGQTPTIDAIWTPNSLAANPTPFPLRQDAGAPRTYVNSKTMIFHGTNAKPGTSVLVYVDGRPDPIARTAVGALTTVDAKGDWATDPSVELTEGSYTARATMSQGDEPPQLSPPIAFSVGLQGPSLGPVSFAVPGPEVGVQRLVVRFQGNTLLPDVAGNAANYTLQASNGTGIFSDNSPKFTPIGVDYSAPTNTATLVFKSLQPDTYQLALTVVSNTAPKGLADAFGNAIAGATAKVVSKPPDAGGETVDGIPKPEKAPNAVFPEFNNPRPPTNGFNPSDHVETRVVRLYYYRDARRVAEILNRDLKSYNQSAVDTRRRLAEKARNDADNLTDQRRRQEVKAVRNAQASRDAQRQLDQAQAALQQSQATVVHPTQTSASSPPCRCSKRRSGSSSPTPRPPRAGPRRGPPPRPRPPPRRPPRPP